MLTHKGLERIVRDKQLELLVEIYNAFSTALLEVKYITQVNI